MVTIKLSNIFAECPVFWQNFLRALQPYESVDVAVDVINQELAVYNARFSDSDTKNYGARIKFFDEELYLLFVLKWS